MKLIIKILPIFLLLISCNSRTAKVDERKPILLADREAPLGWVYLRIYEDSTFEFISRGLRIYDVYSGKAEITKDTIYFNYQDSIPKAGKTAIYNKNVIAYIDGEYPEKIEIKMSRLMEK